MTTVSGTEREHVRYRFAGFELEPCERRLLASGQPVPLTPKVFDTLVLLVERSGNMVTKDELMAALWPRGFVSESNLTKHIWAIRKALADGCDDHPRFIETVPKLGYRFIAPVVRVAVGVGGATRNNPPLPVTDARDVVVQPSARWTEVSPGVPKEHRAFGRRESDRVLASTLLNAHAGLRRRRWGIATGVIALLLIGGLTGGLMWRRAQSVGRGAMPLPRGEAMAIMDFENLSQKPEDAWLAPALAEMLSTEVAVGDTLRVLPRGRVQQVNAGLPSPVAGGYASGALATLRQQLGADYVLSGAYLVSGAGVDALVRVDVVVQDARDGRVLVRLSRTRPAAAVPALVTEVGTALRSRLAPAGSAGCCRPVAGSTR